MQLPPKEARAFRAWYEQFDAEQWDRQIKSDAAGGKLDDLAEQALADHDSGESRRR